MTGDLEKWRADALSLLEQLKREGKLKDVEGMQVSVAEVSPEEEAAQRLDGTFDPAKVYLNVRTQVAQPVEFVKLEFIVGPPKEGK